MGQCILEVTAARAPRAAAPPPTVLPPRDDDDGAPMAAEAEGVALVALELVVAHSGRGGVVGTVKVGELLELDDARPPRHSETCLESARKRLVN